MATVKKHSIKMTLRKKQIWRKQVGTHESDSFGAKVLMLLPLKIDADSFLFSIYTFVLSICLVSFPFAT